MKTEIQQQIQRLSEQMQGPSVMMTGACKVVQLFKLRGEGQS